MLRTLTVHSEPFFRATSPSDKAARDIERASQLDAMTLDNPDLRPRYLSDFSVEASERVSYSPAPPS